MRSLKVGLIGCGNICRAYLNYQKNFPVLEFVACADMVPERAQKAAEEFGLRSVPVDALFEEDLDIILNLTIPAAHAEINLRTLESGKHAYTEKPFALDLESARQVLAKAEVSGLRVGCAPDTFMGGGLQTVRHLIDQGIIGRPTAGMAAMMYGGPDKWHPDPGFFFRSGGGPVLDMAPYYLTALVFFLGPIKAVTARGSKAHEVRIAGHESIAGRELPVEVFTHYSATIEFHSGAVFTMVMSFDVAHHNLPNIQLYGTEGSIGVPDPNTFGGPVKVALNDAAGEPWAEQELLYPFTDNCRSVGLADMAAGILNSRPHRCSGQLALHVLEAMLAFDRSHEAGAPVAIESSVDRPEPLPIDHPESVLDAI